MEINGWHDALQHYEDGTGTTAILSPELINEIKSDFSDYSDAMQQIEDKIESYAEKSGPAAAGKNGAAGTHDSDETITLQGSETMVPIDQPDASWAFLIGVGTLQLDWTAKFDLHKSKDSNCGYYSITISNATVRWNLHKLYSFDQKPTKWGNIANYPFHLIFGKLLGGKDYWIDGDWDDTPNIRAIYTDGDYELKDPNWKGN